MKNEELDTLARSWLKLRLSVSAPNRIPSWDVIIITAASPSQSKLYERQLKLAQRHGRICTETIVLSVPDPQGKRIGSGGATLSAIRTLVNSFKDVSIKKESNSSVEDMKVLLVHAGGDSKRVPWANPIGKPFIPFPLFSNEDIDGPVTTLFDHILAISAPAAINFGSKGGLFIMTGDVLPCFDTSLLLTPENDVCVVTVPSSLDVASHHGVILPTKNQIKSIESMNSDCKNEVSCGLVYDLLQKPSVSEMVARGALIGNSTVLLDTGIFVVCGQAWKELIKLSTANPDPVLELIESGEEMSLYEELASAWVKEKHDWLIYRPLGSSLISYLSNQKLYYYSANDLVFLHFGTSGEILDHFSENYNGKLSRCHLSSIPASTSCHVSTSSTFVTSKISPDSSVGDNCLIFDSFIGTKVKIGSRCIIVGLTIDFSQSDSKSTPNSIVHYKELKSNQVDVVTDENEDLSMQKSQTECFFVPDGCCVWELPLVNGCHVAICCGVNDNPKKIISKGLTFCGSNFRSWLMERNLNDNDVWEKDLKDSKKDLWSARLFPMFAIDEKKLIYLSWMMQSSSSSTSSPFQNSNFENITSEWKKCRRLSMSEIHMLIDFDVLHSKISNQRSKLIYNMALSTIKAKSLSRNFSSLCSQFFEGEEKEAMDLCSRLSQSLSNNGFSFNVESSGDAYQSRFGVPMSRIIHANIDILNLLKKDDGDNDYICYLENHLWKAVALETDQSMDPHHLFSSKSAMVPFSLYDRIGKSCTVRLPARLDLAGGWSDTPPFSLERTGHVLNFSILINGSLPIGATVTVVSNSGVLMQDDEGRNEKITSVSSLNPPFHEHDPFRLVKSALFVTGYTQSNILQSTNQHTTPFQTKPHGLEIRTWSALPRGSGLGSSSILAAAVVKALLEVRFADPDGDDVAASNSSSKIDDDLVSHLVLRLEQRMGTGGGWQDQVGGIFKGVKLTTGFPTKPLGLRVEPVPLVRSLKRELEARLVLIFTGQARVARNVLHNVVKKYLQRDSKAISAIEELARLAQKGKKCLSVANMDELAKVITRVWELHQILDPDCSTPEIDALAAKWKHSSLGFKLVGAGGGGFGMFLAKSAEFAMEMKSICERDCGEHVKVYEWSLWEGSLGS